MPPLPFCAPNPCVRLHPPPPCCSHEPLPTQRQDARCQKHVFCAEVVHPQYLGRFLHYGIKVPNRGTLKCFFKIKIMTLHFTLIPEELQNREVQEIKGFCSDQSAHIMRRTWNTVLSDQFDSPVDSISRVQFSTLTFSSWVGMARDWLQNHSSRKYKMQRLTFA